MFTILVNVVVHNSKKCTMKLVDGVIIIFYFFYSVMSANNWYGTEVLCILYPN